MVTDKNARKLKDILRDAKSGKESDSTEVNAAIGSLMIYFVPFMVFFISLGIASALSFYWLVTGFITYIQQSMIFKQDSEELAETTAKIKVDNGSTAKVVKAEIIQKPKKSSASNKKSTSGGNKKKRR